MGPVTFQPAEPNGRTPASATVSSDLKVLVCAALVTFAAGMLVLAGYMMMDVFGGLLGIGGAIAGVVWWKKTLDRAVVFPREVPGKMMAGLAVVAALLLMFTLGMAS
jgi:hypothetical protein